MEIIKVYENEKEMIKETFEGISKDFVDMLDCVDEPICLDMEITRNGVKVKITLENCDGKASNS